MSTRRSRPAAVTLLTGLFLAGIALGPASPAVAYPAPGRTELMNPSFDGEPHDDFTGNGAATPDGRYVAFHSSSTHIIPGDTNGQRDVFLRDRLTGKVELISVSTGGEQGNGGSSGGPISDDGRYVGFHSRASNLVPGDTNGTGDVFVRDRLEGTTIRVSVAADGTEANGGSQQYGMSADGMRFAIDTAATNMTPEGKAGIFVRDLRTGENTHASVASDGTPADDAVNCPAISADGNVVAFCSLDADLVGGDTFGYNDIFVHDLTTGETERVSVSVDGAQAGANSYYPVLSGDGRFVAYYSDADDLVPWDVNGATDVFLRDRLTDTTELVSVNSSGEQSMCTQCLGAWSENPSISRDGRYVSFETWGTNMFPNDSNYLMDIVVHDRATGTTQLASAGPDGKQVYGAILGILSADGGSIVFTDVIDFYRRELGPAVGVGELRVEGSEASGWARFAGPHRAAASDVVGDAGTAAEDLGLELTGASMTHRPETEDILVRWDVRRFPKVSQPIPTTISQIRMNVRPIPGLVYGMEFTAGGVRYEARATWTDPERPTEVPQSFRLYRCETTCAEVARLGGGIATAGNDVRMSIPITALGGATALSALRAFSAAGEQAPGAVVTVDEVTLPGLTLPAPTARLGVAAPGTSESQVDFTVPAAVSEGRFSVTLPAFQGERDVWARACLGQICGSTRVRVSG